MTAAVRSPTPQPAILSPAAADLCAQHLAPLMAITDPAVRLTALTALGDALAELVSAVAEERAYAIDALRLPPVPGGKREGVRPLARRLRMDESRVRQLLRLIEGAETDSADVDAAPVEAATNGLARDGAEAA